MLELSALETMRRYFEHRQDITAVYLFGSTVKDVGRKGSGLDLAVLFGEGLDQYHRFQEKLQVASESFSRDALSTSLTWPVPTYTSSIR